MFLTHFCFPKKPVAARRCYITCSLLHTKISVICLITNAKEKSFPSSSLVEASY